MQVVGRDVNAWEGRVRAYCSSSVAISLAPCSMECLGGLCYRVRLVVHVLSVNTSGTLVVRSGRLGGRDKLASRFIVLSQNFLRFLTNCQHSCIN